MKTLLRAASWESSASKAFSERAAPRARAWSVLIPFGTVSAMRSSSDSAPISASILAMSAGRGPIWRSGNPERASIGLPSFSVPRLSARRLQPRLSRAVHRPESLRGSVAPSATNSFWHSIWHRTAMSVVSPARRHRQRECSGAAQLSTTHAGPKREEWRGSGKGGEPEPRSALLAKSRQGISIGGCQGFPLAPVVGLGTAR